MGNLYKKLHTISVCGLNRLRFFGYRLYAVLIILKREKHLK